MDAETLNADFYRDRARFCHTLADAATAAKPLFARLYFLAKVYEERTKTAELAAGQAVASSNRPPALRRSPQQLAR
jgi:hypothetical protein